METPLNIDSVLDAQSRKLEAIAEKLNNEQVREACSEASAAKVARIGHALERLNELFEDIESIQDGRP